MTQFQKNEINEKKNEINDGLASLLNIIQQRTSSVSFC